MISWIRERKKVENEGNARLHWMMAETEKLKMIEGKDDYEGNDRRNEIHYAERRRRKWRNRSTQAVDNAQVQNSTV